MEWNVLYYNVNSGHIEKYNVLYRREEAIAKLKRKAKTKDEFAEELRKEMMYYFWSKFEWEITVSSYGRIGDGRDVTRVDAWDQINLNWNRFVDYCWST